MRGRIPVYAVVGRKPRAASCLPPLSFTLYPMNSVSRLLLVAALALASLAPWASAANFTFNTAPFAGSTALITPGRQVVAGESFISFDPATDVFLFDPAAFGLSSLSFDSGLIGDIASSAVAVAVLQTLDNDGNTGTPFGAGNAANLLADRIVTPGAGFFLYFNQGLDLPRLVFSTDLSDPTADLQILARLTNLKSDPGSLAGFTAAHFKLLESPPSVPDTTPGLVSFGTLTLLLAVVRRFRPA